MTPLNAMDSAYLFDRGYVRLHYQSSDPYPYAGGDDITAARHHLRASFMRRHACDVGWCEMICCLLFRFIYCLRFRVPGWIFLCPKYTIGFSYAWENGVLSVDLSPKNTKVSA